RGHIRRHALQLLYWLVRRHLFGQSRLAAHILLILLRRAELFRLVSLGCWLHLRGFSLTGFVLQTPPGTRPGTRPDQLRDQYSKSTPSAKGRVRKAEDERPGTKQRHADLARTCYTRHSLTPWRAAPAPVASSRAAPPPIDSVQSRSSPKPIQGPAESETLVTNKTPKTPQSSKKSDTS